MYNTEGRDALNNIDDVTEGQVLLYLQRHTDEGALAGGSTCQPEQFWQLGDLDKYKAALAWWPTDAPVNCQLGTLIELLDTSVSGQGMSIMPFMVRVEFMWRRCCAWLTEQGRNLEHPNETREQRAARHNRERVARHRKHKAAPADSPIRQTHAHLQQVRADRTLVLAQHDEAVRQAQATFMAAAAERKAAAAAHDGFVAAAKQAWESAKAGG